MLKPERTSPCCQAPPPMLDPKLKMKQTAQ